MVMGLLIDVKMLFSMFVISQTFEYNHHPSLLYCYTGFAKNCERIDLSYLL